MDNQQPIQSSQPGPTLVQSPQPSGVPSNRSSKFWVLFLLLIVLAGCVVYGTYNWQHSKVTKLNTQVLTLKGQSVTQTKAIANLNKRLSGKAAASTTGPFDQTAAITQAVKAYKDDVNNASQLTVTINGVTASGNAAYGGVSTAGNGGGGWLAVNKGGTWSVVSQGDAGICSSQVQQYNLPSVWAGDNSIC